MIIVAGKINVPPAGMGDYRKAAAAVIAATRQEKGCQVYAFAEDVLEPGLIRIFEIWDTMADLDAHGAAPHMTPWREALAGIGTTGRDIRTYETEGGKPL